MKAIWIVRWRGLDEQCSCSEEAMGRWDQLDARGIEAEVYEVLDGKRRRVMWISSGGALPHEPAATSCPAFLGLEQRDPAVKGA